MDGVEQKHVQDLAAIQVYLRADSIARKKLAYPFRGTNPAFLQYAAWDVAELDSVIAQIDRSLGQRL